MGLFQHQARIAALIAASVVGGCAAERKMELPAGDGFGIQRPETIALVHQLNEQIAASEKTLSSGGGDKQLREEVRELTKYRDQLLKGGRCLPEFTKESK